MGRNAFDVANSTELETGIHGRSHRLWSCALVMLAFFTPSTTKAVDGVIEINEACAAVGCFPGDNPGFPVFISQSGSYRLTSNLSTNDPATSVITIGADYVTLDLNGFTISGPTTCASGPTTCTNTGSGDGIKTVNNYVRGATVRGGTVRGMGDQGVWLGFASHIIDMRVIENGGDGIRCNMSCTVERSTVMLNGDWGVFQSSFVDSESGGITKGSSLFSENRISLNANGLFSNDSGSKLITSNVITSNDGLGIQFFGGLGGYSNNVLRDNNGGGANPQFAGSAVETGPNLCGSNTTCP